MRSQQLWQQTHDLCKPNQTTSYLKRGVWYKVPHLAKELFGIVSFWEEESPFSKDVAPEESTVLQCKAIQSREFGQHNLALMGKKKNRHKTEWIEKGVWVWEELWRGKYDQNKQYEILKEIIYITYLLFIINYNNCLFVVIMIVNIYSYQL